MKIDDVIEENVTGVCKESGKPIVNGKCVCSGEPIEKQCGCQDHIDIKKIIPFIILNAKSYKGTIN